MKINDELVLLNCFEKDDFDLDNEYIMTYDALKEVIKSSVVSEDEKDLFIDMMYRRLHLETLERSFNKEIETDENKNEALLMDKILSRAKLETNNLYNKFIIYSPKQKTYITKDNKFYSIDNYELCKTVINMKTFSTEEEALEAIKELNLDNEFNQFEAININSFTEIDNDIEIDYLFKPFDYLDYIK